MRFPINLASQPFRRDRAMIAATVALSATLLMTLGVLVWLAMADRRQMADVRADIARLNARMQALGAEQSQLNAVLQKPENAEVLDLSVFLNDLLIRKGISWTRIFADLEKAVPHNVRVIQIHPTVDAQNRITLDMQVGAEAAGPIIEMVKKMAEAPFSNPDPKLLQPPTQAEPLYRYRLSVEYAQKL